MEKLLEIENLSIRYRSDMGTVEAVNNLRLELKKGETLGIVGETGAGKTTTAFGIIRLLPKKQSWIESGKVVFNGTDLNTLNEKKMSKIRGKEIAMIFQDPMTSLNPIQTVREQITESIILHSTIPKNKIRERVDEVAEHVGLSKARLNEYPHQYSGGMKQRVIIAMALACNPQLIIADEPTSALDVTIQAQILAMIDRLKKEYNTSMILISHDLGVVVEMCDRVAIMYAGEIVETGVVEDIYASPMHPYTKGLFNCIPYIDDKRERLDTIAGLMPDPTKLPSGCKFHPRCSKSMECCVVKHPPAVDVNGHQISCWLYAESENLRVKI